MLEDAQPRSLRACSRDDPECGARRGVSLLPLVPAKAGTQLLDSRFRGNEREREATVERREASVPRHGTQGASQAPGVSRHKRVSRASLTHMIRPTGVPPSTRTSLGAPPTLFPGARSNDAKPRARKTRRGNEMGCLKSEQGYERIRRYRASCEEPTFTCGRIRSIVSGLLFTMKTATRTCEPSARGAIGNTAKRRVGKIA
jgi:hypothetical protein